MIEKLEVYKKSYELTEIIYRALPEMERFHRFTVGSRMIDCALEMFKWISLANNTKDKAQRLNYLDGVCTNFEQLKVYVKICSDFRIIKIQSQARMYVLIEDISKQLCGWKRVTENRVTERA